ncbi:MAG: hypothetical protein PHN55_16225, partial [Dysgonamonadaceae bacterium]|nr:hypothetical protein [Dysgonamonadaceae bacterium]
MLLPEYDIPEGTYSFNVVLKDLQEFNIKFEKAVDACIRIVNKEKVEEIDYNDLTALEWIDPLLLKEEDMEKIGQEFVITAFEKVFESAIQRTNDCLCLDNPDSVEKDKLIAVINESSFDQGKL